MFRGHIDLRHYGGHDSRCGHRHRARSDPAIDLRRGHGRCKSLRRQTDKRSSTCRQCHGNNAGDCRASYFHGCSKRHLWPPSQRGYPQGGLALSRQSLCIPGQLRSIPSIRTHQFGLLRIPLLFVNNEIPLGCNSALTLGSEHLLDLERVKFAPGDIHCLSLRGISLRSGSQGSLLHSKKRTRRRSRDDDSTSRCHGQRRCSNSPKSFRSAIGPGTTS